MTEETKPETAWFRHKLSGQVFEAAGKQLAESRKKADLEEVPGPDEALKMELDKRGVKYPANTGSKRLRELLAEAQAKDAPAT